MLVQKVAAALVRLSLHITSFPATATSGTAPKAYVSDHKQDTRVTWEHTFIKSCIYVLRYPCATTYMGYDFLLAIILKLFALDVDTNNQTLLHSYSNLPISGKATA
jgi:hypothetical protein